MHTPSVVFPVAEVSSCISSVVVYLFEAGLASVRHAGSFEFSPGEKQVLLLFQRNSDVSGSQAVNLKIKPVDPFSRRGLKKCVFVKRIGMNIQLDKNIW